jgi:hypothetical protein
VLSLLKRKPKMPVKAELVAPEPMRRNRQQNIKVTGDCSVAFAAVAEEQGMSKAALFEDMVAERLAQLERQGFRIGAFSK